MDRRIAMGLLAGLPALPIIHQLSSRSTGEWLVKNERFIVPTIREEMGKLLQRESNLICQASDNITITLPQTQEQVRIIGPIRRIERKVRWSDGQEHELEAMMDLSHPDVRLESC